VLVKGPSAWGFLACASLALIVDAAAIKRLSLSLRSGQHISLSIIARQLRCATCKEEKPSWPKLMELTKEMMTIFAVPVFDATVIVDDNELFKGKGSAGMWAEKLAAEIGGEVTVRKIGAGWALCGQVDGVDCIWGIHGQRLKRVGQAL
jgi:hypothetical protein